MDKNDFKVQWFPGHMTRAKRMMQEQVKLVDVVVELLDARIPLSSSNPMLKQLLQDKPKVVALNKADMADPVQTKSWVRFFETKGLVVSQIECATGSGVKQLLQQIQTAAKPVMEKWTRRGVKNRPVRVMIVGVPNVGKSTLINRLVGKRKTVTADRPGVTRGQQWITIAKGLELLDTPGVLWPKFDNPSTGFALAVTGAIKDDVYDRYDAAILLLQDLKLLYPDTLANFYGVAIEADDTAEILLEKIGKARGCLKSGGIIDSGKALQLLLRDFRTAKLGRFTLERKILQAEER